MKKVSKIKKKEEVNTLVFVVDPTECPFREFKDNELGSDLWGLGPAATRATLLLTKSSTRSIDHAWIDEQTQPLPRSIRRSLHRFVRAEDLAYDMFDSDIAVFDSESDAAMSLVEYQMSHKAILTRSSYCRRVLSACFMLEKAEGLIVEHQWDNFVFNIGPEGWRARYHIYSPGVKAGGGPAHRPPLSKNGCYLVRLFYLGSWRCVWVNDQVPVDGSSMPLLPFAPLITRTPPKPGTKGPGTTVISSEVLLWPMLLCKALMKLAAPRMDSEVDASSKEDEKMPEFDILHALTGCMHLKYKYAGGDRLWQHMVSEIPVFTWDDDDETQGSTKAAKTSKKAVSSQNAKANSTRTCMASLEFIDTQHVPPYSVPGVTPAYPMQMLVTQIRDLPLKKPLPEPDVALWKYYRWVDWAKAHGLYEAYDCPRTKFIRANGLMKLSYAPHLLDVQSTESITYAFVEEHERITGIPPKKRDDKKAHLTTSQIVHLNKEELKEWVPYELVINYINSSSILYYPSVFEFTSAGDVPPLRINRIPNRARDIQIPKTAPLYLQIDGPDNNILRVSLSMLHPRVLFNCGVLIEEYMEPAYVLVEEFHWFEGGEIPVTKAYIQTKQYESMELEFKPGRHYCRIWIHSRMNCHVMMLSESALLLGTRDMILEATIHECPWSARFLSNLGAAFVNWLRAGRSTAAVGSLDTDREFYTSYAPDLKWDPLIVGYNKALLHWMFRQALQSFFAKKLSPIDYSSVCNILRHLFYDPDFGFPPKPLPRKSLREFAISDPCDCPMPEMEEIEMNEELLEETHNEEEKPLVNASLMEELLTAPKHPEVSKVCELATDSLPCGVLKEERDEYLKRHEAATFIQAYWRGHWSRKCLEPVPLFSADVIKLIMDNAFGTIESLSGLMNEFFRLYPGAKWAYSVASALKGTSGLAQHQGTSHVGPSCKWVPYFQAVYYCHGPVKVHFDVRSNLPYSSFSIYDNDTGEHVLQAYNAHHTFDFNINTSGYTVFAHGTLHEPVGHSMEASWQLTVLSSIAGNFHICDNEISVTGAGVGCTELPLNSATKLHISEIFIPNRRNIVGGILISVMKLEAVSFRCASTCPSLEMVASLKCVSYGQSKEIANCSGRGEIYWPYICLQPSPPDVLKNKSVSHANLYTKEFQGLSARSLKSPKAKPTSAGRAQRSALKLKESKFAVEAKTYCIEVTAPEGWPLTISQWTRVMEIRNSIETAKISTPTAVKKSTKTDKKQEVKETPHSQKIREPILGDAFVELECSLSNHNGTFARRDDLRDLEFTAAVKSWEMQEPGRNLRGEAIRQEFRSEFLDVPLITASTGGSTNTIPGEDFEEEIESKKESVEIHQGPTPATDSFVELEVESEEEAKYLLMPDVLKDKFIPLNFLPQCLREKSDEESVVMSPDMAEAARQERLARIEASIERMHELQQYNLNSVLAQQSKRAQLLEMLFVDSYWGPELEQVLELRDEAIVQEVLARQASAAKKKTDAKSETSKGKDMGKPKGKK